MAWHYSQKTGTLSWISAAGIGYSGNGEGLNNPDAQQVHDVGPIPRGMWSVGKFFDDAGGKGPLVANLVPTPGTDTFGRDGFMIHGDNTRGDKSASHGCIILPHWLREVLGSSSDRVFIVDE